MKRKPLRKDQAQTCTGTRRGAPGAAACVRERGSQSLALPSAAQTTLTTSPSLDRVVFKGFLINRNAGGEQELEKSVLCVTWEWVPRMGGPDMF